MSKATRVSSGVLAAGSFHCSRRRIRAVAEIHAVPEFLVREFARVIDDADQAAPFGLELLAGLGKLALGLLQVARVGEPGARHVRDLIDIEQAAIVKRLAVEPDMPAGVEIDFHAPLLHRAERLRGPGTAGLAVAGWAPRRRSAARRRSRAARAGRIRRRRRPSRERRDTAAGVGCTL